MRRIHVVLFFLLLLNLAGCAAIGEIFKAGVWFGVLFVLGVIALVVFFVTRSSNKS